MRLQFVAVAFLKHEKRERLMTLVRRDEVANTALYLDGIVG